MPTSSAGPIPDDQSDGLGPVAITAGFVAIFGLCVLSVYFTPGDSQTAAWWPAAGVGTGLLVLCDPRRWPMLLALTVLVTAAANAVGGRDLAVSGLFGLANAAEGLVVALLLGARRGRPWLRTQSDFARLIAAAAAGAVTAGVLVGAIVGTLTEGPWLATALDVIPSHGASQLLVLPLALLLTDPMATERSGTRPRALLLGQVVATLMVTFLVHRQGQHLPLTFLPAPFLVWGGLVLSLRAIAAEALAVGALVTVLTAQGGGPFANVSSLPAQSSAALVQVNLVMIALAALPLALVAAERAAALREAIAGREVYRRSQHDLREQQQALRQQQDFTAALLAATTGTSIIATDADGLITFVNSGAVNLLGHPAEDLIGRRHLVWLHEPAELERRAHDLGVDTAFGALTAEVQRTGEPDRHDWTYRCDDGRILTMNVHLSRLQDLDGRLIGYLAAGEDVTDRERAERTLRRALDKEREAVERLSELDRSKSEFLSTVSHELRTPMTSILGFNQLLAGEVVGPLNARQHDLLRRVDRGGQRLFGLIENVLALSRAESATDRSRHVAVDLSSVVQSAVEATEHLRWDRSLGLVVDVAVADTAVVEGDRDQLERLVINLMSNATKFTPDGGSISVGLDLHSPRTIAIAVRDTGIGIPLEEQHHLFDRFFRASNAVSGAIPGTGLGLGIARTIVEAHHGELTLLSATDEGTSVTVTLPRRGSSAVDDAPGLERAG